jgi:hypothetical protein
MLALTERVGPQVAEVLYFGAFARAAVFDNPDPATTGWAPLAAAPADIRSRLCRYLDMDDHTLQQEFRRTAGAIERIAEYLKGETK